ncbi:MAG: UDP-N-acetylmuramoyl-L-alanyl-D-glutamate--2,6-diaminopimelate ligase [Phycisphaerales bacterium]|nr:MAG: UDP-N-acetylmuramoyl-L-alanyl-D-glutamate--2,6-diaminopimelate ligase [Phycisphaerales bacterium]
MNSLSRSTSRHSLADLLERAGVYPEGGGLSSDVEIVSLTDDSRVVGQGGLFVAVRGHAVDGHRFVEFAAAAGAAAVVVEGGGRFSLSADCRVIRVDDSREALARLAAAFYGLCPASACPLHLIGITGTNGKTTVSWMLRSIVSAAGLRAALIGTVEYDLCRGRMRAPLTTPGAIDLCRHLSDAAEAGATHAILEVSSHALDQRRTDGLFFDIAAFTNFSGDHLDYHGTSEAYLAAKRRLFERLDEHAVAIVNADDPAGRTMADAIAARVIWYGMESSKCDVRARIVSVDRRACEFVLCGSGPEVLLRCPLAGRHNVSNALAASTIALSLGIDSDAIRRGIEGLARVPGRLERVSSDACPFDVYVDYAHTDDALDNVLSVLRPLTKGRLICVFGCGGDRDRSKRPRMAAAVARYADVAYVTSDNPRTEKPEAIIEQILPGFARQSRCAVQVDADRRQAIEAAIGSADTGDTVLIAGKGHEDYQLVGAQVLHFDDREVARECLARLAITAEDAA